jgi:hypothetical protein
MKRLVAEHKIEGTAREPRVGRVRQLEFDRAATLRRSLRQARLDAWIGIKPNDAARLETLIEQSQSPTASATHVQNLWVSAAGFHHPLQVIQRAVQHMLHPNLSIEEPGTKCCIPYVIDGLRRPTINSGRLTDK